MSRAIRRVCVVRFGGMGDILLSTPAVRAVSERFGTREIDYVVARGNRDALTGIPYLREVIEWGPRGEEAKPANLLAFLRRVRSARYDLFINFQPSIKTVLMSVAAAAGGARVLTFRKDIAERRDTGRVPHAVDDFLKELRPLGITDVPDRGMDFAIPDAARQKVDDLLAAAGIGPRDLLVVVNPGGTRHINRWATANYAALLNRFAASLPGVRLAVTGGPDDVERAREVVAGLDAKTTALNLAHQLSIKETGALLLRAGVFVTPDTGPLHIASALGVPLVTLSGAADPDRTGPRNVGDLVVIRRDLSCVPCRARSCYRHDVACMAGMPVDWVFEASLRRLADQGVIPPVPPPPPGFGIEQVGADGRVPLPMLRAGDGNVK
jgi:heptosyltransferase II